MSTIRRVVCALRGHAWQTTEDAFGPLTTCARCGALQHTAGGGAPEVDSVSEKGMPGSPGGE